ncbi:MAG: hypothetical protein ABW092_21300 [Candidatus Thiodiazotropha sp.]
MKKTPFLLIWIVASLISLPDAFAVNGVNPNGVNVKASGVTTVFLTFQGLAAGQTAAESFWCGDVVTTAVSNTNPCLPGTLFGRLPARHDLSTVSGTAGLSNLTDIMTVPASVARRAYQAARSGAAANFFYVRRFSGGGPDQYVTVTCRMAGGGARTPLALTDVRLRFDTPGEDRPVYHFDSDQVPSPLFAEIRYNGTGRLKGRWEVVMPGDLPPAPEDLLTEASLPMEQRARQRRYTLVDRFDIFLPPTGEVRLPGPDPRLLPHQVDGAYQLLLRIEASEEREGNSNTLSGVVRSGGVAGFPMPVLRYVIGTASDGGGVISGKLLAISPAGEMAASALQTPFTWTTLPRVPLYLLEIRGQEGVLLEAVVAGDQDRYLPPPWLFDNKDLDLAWRITALDRHGNVDTRSAWQEFTITR